jgi:glutathione S-transferase
MSIKLWYFDGYGRAEAIRMMLTYLEAPFEDIRLSFEEFGKLKAEGKFEFGQLPAAEWEGKQYS